MVLLFLQDRWLMVIGSDSPSFALYGDGTVIFEKKTDQNVNQYYSAKLSSVEHSELLKLVSGLATANNHYGICEVTDQPSNI